MQLQKIIKTYVRRQFSTLAVWIDRHFGTVVSPDRVTYVGFIAHVPIAILIAQGHLLLGGLLLIIFGLFDTLDGALARVQGVSSPRGMFLDASTDRLKEVLIYAGFVYFFIEHEYATWTSLIAVLTVGLSLSVSYVKAKGEAALASSKTIDHAVLNRIFEDGLGSFETRIALLVVGCLAGYPEYAIVVIFALTINTLIVRMRRVLQALSA